MPQNQVIWKTDEVRKNQTFSLLFLFKLCFKHSLIINVGHFSLCYFSEPGGKECWLWILPFSVLTLVDLARIMKWLLTSQTSQQATTALPQHWQRSNHECGRETSNPRSKQASRARCQCVEIQDMEKPVTWHHRNATHKIQAVGNFTG